MNCTDVSSMFQQMLCCKSCESWQIQIVSRVYKYPSFCRAWNFTPVIKAVNDVRSVVREGFQEGHSTPLYRLCSIFFRSLRPPMQRLQQWKVMKFIFARRRSDAKRRAELEGWKGVLFSKWSTWMESDGKRLKANWLLPTPLTHVFAFWLCCVRCRKNCYEPNQ